MAMLDDSPAVWKWESRQQARARARSQIQTIGEAVAPHVASGDFGAAQQALAQATQPAAGTPTPWTKMISNNLKAKLGGAMDAGQAAATRPQAFEGRPTDTGGSDLSPKTLAAETLPQTLARKARQDRAENPNDSGLMSSLSDAAGGVNQLFSGRKFVQGVTQGRVDTADLPGPILPVVADMGLAPATIATAGFGGAAAGAGAGGKVVAANLAKKWAADTAIATTGALAAQKEGELQNRFAQSDLPGADIAGSRVAQLAGSTAAFVGGAVAAHKFGPAALRAAASAPEAVSGAAARAGIVPEGAVPGGGMVRTLPVTDTGTGEAFNVHWSDGRVTAYSSEEAAQEAARMLPNATEIVKGAPHVADSATLPTEPVAPTTAAPAVPETPPAEAQPPIEPPAAEIPTPAKGDQPEPLTTTPTEEPPPSPPATEASSATVGFPGDAAPPSGRDGPRITTAADGSERQVPARGNALAAQALEQKQVMTTPQGRVSRAVDSTPIIRRIAAAVNPARDMPENIVTAYRAEGGVGSMLRSKFSAAMADPTQTLAQALADNPPEYIGPAGTAEQMALVGTAKDVLDRPEFYRIQPKLRAAMNYYDRAQWDHVTAPVRAGYNVDVQPYSGNPGSVYTPTMVARGSDDERIAQAMQSLASKANAKTRLYESAWERVGSNPEFKPETDLRNLTDAHSKAMARNASNETFKLGAGGKTGTEVAEELHPELLRMKNDARTGLASLQAKLKTATADQQQQIGEFRKTQTVINRVNDRMEPLQARVDALGEEYGPELSYLSGQVRELQLQKTALQAALQNTGQKVVFRGTQTGALMDAIDKAQTNVAQLVKSYANAATDPYIFDRDTMRYYTPEAAKSVSELKRMPTGFLKGTMEALDEIRAWHFSGDASPLTIQGQLGALADPISTARTVQSIIGDGLNSPVKALAKIAQEQPEDVADFSFSMNRPFGEASAEFEQPKGFARLGAVGRKISSFEQNMFALVERQTFDMWKKQRDDLMAHGMEKNGANHAAAAVTQQVIPSLDPTRRAISPLRAGAERAAFTSVSFATSPALMLKDATVAIAKLGTARTVNPGDAWAMLSPREQLALKRTLTTAATVGTISAASAAASAESRGLSVKDAILQTFDPRSRYFAAVQLGGGRAIPIGGPMRGFLKALAPSEFTPDKDGLPMAGLWDYTQGKLNSAPRIVKDLVQNSDYNGNKIMTGTFGQRVLQSLWYAGENVAPMTAGQTMTDTRQGNLSAGGTLQRVASQLAGTNYSGPSPTEQLNQISRSQGHGDFYSADPSVQQAIKQANPALWQEAVNAGSANRQKAEGLKKQTLTDQQGDDDLLLQGKLDVSKWASSADTRKTQLTGAEAAIYQDSPATSGAHPILDQFYQQIDASKVNGEPDMNAVYAWVAEQSPAAQKYIADNTGLSKTPVQKLRTNLLDEYYALPKYHGYSADEATQIDDVLAQARNNAKGTNAGNNQVYVLQALRNLKGVDPDTLSAARKVVLGLVKETTDRTRWTKAHPESVIMYGQGKLTPEQIASVQKALKA